MMSDGWKQIEDVGESCSESNGYCGWCGNCQEHSEYLNKQSQGEED